MTCRRVLSTIRGCAATWLLLCGVAGAQSVLQITTAVFPLTPVGQSATANVQLTVASGGNQVIYSAIQLAPGSSDYTLGAITGCVVDGTTPNVDGTTCTIPVIFQPTRPGKAGSPQPIARTVALQVYDTENGNPQQYSLGLIGSGTMPRRCGGSRHDLGPCRQRCSPADRLRWRWRPGQRRHLHYALEHGG